MAPIAQTEPGDWEQFDLLATIVFLGALCCAVVGIKLKGFKAQLRFTNLESNSNSNQSRGDVYTSYEPGIYAPSFRVIDETEYDKPSNIQISRPKLQSSTNNNIPPVNNVVNKQKIDEGFPSGFNEQSTSSNENKLDVSSKNKEKDKQSKKEKEQLAKKEKEEKAKAEKVAKEEKARAEKAAKEEKVRTEKEAKEKARAEKEAKEEKAKLKKEKEKKDGNVSSDDKTKKERKKKRSDKTKKRDKDKREKSKKPKDKTPKQAASVTIDAEAVESTERNLLKANSSSEALDKPKNPTRNVRNRMVDNQPQQDASFTSSWDMVAQHRQNLHREVKSPIQNTLRSMADQNNGAMARNPMGNSITDFDGGTNSSLDVSDTEA